jgi:hypothetical protein
VIDKAEDLVVDDDPLARRVGAEVEFDSDFWSLLLVTDGSTVDDEEAIFTASAELSWMDADETEDDEEEDDVSTEVAEAKCSTSTSAVGASFWLLDSIVRFKVGA